jgi:hypothetical protein
MRKKRGEEGNQTIHTLHTPSMSQIEDALARTGILEKEVVMSIHECFGPCCPYA